MPNAVNNAVDSAGFHSRSHDAVIRVYDAVGNVIETHDHAGDFRLVSIKAREIKSRHAVMRDG